MPPLTAPDAQAPQLPAVRAVSEPAGGLGPQLRCSHTQARGGPPRRVSGHTSADGGVGGHPDFPMGPLFRGRA